MSLVLEPFSTVFSISDYQFQSTSRTVEDIEEEDASHIATCISKRLSSATLGAGSELSSNDDAIQHCSGRKTCVTCGIADFEDELEHRIHFKTDWHRFNVKLRALNKKPVLREEDFNALVEQGGGLDDDVGSISGSDESLSDDDDDEMERNQDASLLAPYCIFRVRSIRDGTLEYRLAVWKCLLVPPSSRGDHAKKMNPIECVQRLQEMKGEGQQWAVVMFQGGHFAACVYTIESPSDNILQRTDKASHEIAELSMKEIAHKSFHRYVVRAKAGGKQSDKDGTGKVAKSAGSRLRRYNEAMLNKQVVETLDAWKDILSNCNLIFISCPGSNRLVLFGGDAPPLDKNDERIRKIPFTTRRPTISETKRVVRTLLTIYKYTPREIHREDTVEQREQQIESHKADADVERRRAEKLELQRQQLLAQERNRKKKERRKEQKRAARMKDTESPKEGEGTEEKEVDNLDAALKNLAAAASESTMKRSMANQKNPPKSKEKARSKKNSEDVVTRREKLAAAAEARAKALAAASSNQKLWMSAILGAGLLVLTTIRKKQ